MQLTPESKAYQFLQWMFFPCLLIGAPMAVFWLIQHSVHFALATYGGVVFVGIVFFLFERFMPYREHWNHLDGDLANDVISSTIAYGIVPKIITPIYWALLAGVTATIASWAGGAVWPSHWPMWAQLILLMLAGDAGRYWGHRLAHNIPVMWRFHAIHHSASRLWFFNAMRQHPVDKIWFTFTELCIPIMLGVNGEVIGLYFVVTAVCGFTQHCNINLRLGYLYWVFNVCELHRWHHSKIAKESDNNFGNNLIIYDRLFGTYFHPEDHGDQEGVAAIGLVNPNYPKNYLGQFLAPFRQGKLDKEQE